MAKDFLLKIRGRYKIGYENNKVIKLIIQHSKNKEYPVTYFINNDKENISAMLKQLQGQEVEIICEQGYISKYQKNGQWIKEVTTVLESISIGSDEKEIHW